jgi:ABC-2 type transport system permease protein
MKEFWILFKMQLNINFGLSALRYRFRKEQDKIPQSIFMAIAIVIAVGGIVAFYSLLMSTIYSAGAAAGNPQIVLVMAFLGLQLFLLITGIFYMIGVFYYSKDLSALAPLPLKPWQVMGAKFAVVMVYEYLMALPILLPPILIYGIGLNEGFFYWLKAVLLILVSPALPMLLASLLAVVLMRFINIGRRKDMLAVAGGTFVTVAVLALNLMTQRFASSTNDPSALTRLIADQAQFINSISLAFPPSAWATFALAQNGLNSFFYLLLYIALSAALLGLLFCLANKFYYKSALLIDEVSRKGKPEGSKRGRLITDEAAGPVRAVFMRELKMLLRTPAFAMNCLIGSLIIPIIIPITLVQGSQAAGIIDLVRNPANSLEVTLGAAALMMFSAMINVTASTALSREGKAFWMSKMIPVSPQRQVYAKFLLSMAVVCLGLVLSAILLVFFLQLDIYWCILALMLSLLGAIPITIVNMLPDLIKPKLAWTNPYEAVKQNLNVLFSMMAACVLVGFEVLVVLLMVLVHLPQWVIYLVLTGLLIVLSALGAKVLSVLSNRFYKIEV